MMHLIIGSAIAVDATSEVVRVWIPQRYRHYAEDTYTIAQIEIVARSFVWSLLLCVRMFLTLCSSNSIVK